MAVNNVRSDDGSRIVFVDPNELYGYGKTEDNDSKNVVPLTPPYEDMCIAFNLIIEQYSRFDITDSKTVKLAWTDTPNGRSPYFSVLDGELKTANNKALTDKEYDSNSKYDNSYLTTYYTEISSDGFKKHEQLEGLGVSSIQVSFESYFVPTVTIQFIDVLGSALFGREEAIHSSRCGDGAINASNIFGAFFTQPYPKFRLQMKGFYGRDVTYQLTLSGCKAKLNAKTGNVELTANFIGYTWAMLTDIPLNYLIAAPKCKYIGEEYWNEHIKDRIENEPWELKHSEKYEGIRSKYPQTLDEFFKKIQVCIKRFDDINAQHNQTDETEIANNRDKLDSLREYLTDYDNEVNNLPTSITNKNDLNDLNEKYLKIYEWFNLEGSELGLTAPINDKCYQQNTEEDKETTYTITFNTSDIRSEISEKESEYENMLQDSAYKAKEEFIKEALNEIKMDPNIYNIFKMLMCHLETFVQIFFAAAREIRDQSKRNERTPEYLGIKIENTDMPSRYDRVKSVNLPPWVAVFNDKNTSIVNEDTIDYSSTYKWIGELNEADRWVEQKVVWNLNDAVQRVFSKEEENAVSTTNYRNSDTIYNLPCDVNLYGSYSKIFNQTLNKQRGFDNLCSALGIRAAQLFGVAHKYLVNDVTMSKLMGEIDAYNFFISVNSINDIKEGVIERVSGDMAKTVLSILTCDKSDNDKNNSITEDNGNEYHSFEQDKPNGQRHPMYEKTNNGYKYVYFLDKNKMPLIPSVLGDSDTYKKVIRPDDPGTPSADNTELHYYGVVNNGKSNKWLCINSDKQNVYKDKDGNEEVVINEDMFKIIDDKSVIENIVERFNKLKKGKFSVKGYEVDNEKDFKEFVTKNYSEGYTYKVTSRFLNKSNKDEVNSDIKGKIVDFDHALPIDKSEEKINIHRPLKNDDYIENYFVKNIEVHIKNINLTTSLFSHPLYYMQSVDKNDPLKGLCSRALLFLRAMYGDIIYDEANKDKTNFNLYEKIDILFTGAVLWYNKNTDAFKTNENNDIIYEVDLSKKYYVEINSIKKDKGKGKIILPNIPTPFNKNVEKQLIDYFENFVKKTFINIDLMCQLKDDDNEDFNNAFSFRKWFNEKSSKKNSEVKLNNNNYAYGYFTPHKGYINLILDEDKTELQNILKDVLFTPILCMKCGDALNSNVSNEIIIPTASFEGYLNTFKSTLDKIYAKVSESGSIYKQDTLIKDNDDQKINNYLATYLYCKNLWEKWLMPMSGSSFKSDPNNIISENHLELYEEEYNVEHFFNKKFKFIDSYYNDISTKMKLNLDIVYESYIGRSQDCSLNTYISDIVGKHRCLYVALPDFVDLGLTENKEAGLAKMKDMFRPIPYNAMGAPQLENNFIIMYTYPPASKMPTEFTHRDDGFDIYSTDVVPEFFKSATRDGVDNNNELTKYGYNVPSFCVAFNKQNNHLFKEFNISMENPIETSSSIISLTNIAKLSKDGDRRIAFCGQDIYNIFSNYSYIIEIEMMGDAQIQPLMYFQLMNVPMWRGVYMIFSVTHDMTPGNMTTKFKAMKLSKNPVPFISKWWSTIEYNYFMGNTNMVNNSDNENYYRVPDIKKFLESGKNTGLTKKSASDANLMVGGLRNGRVCNIGNEYFNCGHNNYFNVNEILTQTVFALKDGSKYDLKKVVNFIYNQTHINLLKCSVKQPIGVEGSVSRCAEYVFNAVGNGFDSFISLKTGNAGDMETNKDALNPYFEFHSPDDVDVAYPGDILLQQYIKDNGETSGHASMFTGKHWVSDFIHPNGIDSGNKGIGKYALYRIPGIEKYIRKSSKETNIINRNQGTPFKGDTKTFMGIINDEDMGNINNTSIIYKYDRKQFKNYLESFIKYGELYKIDYRLLIAVAYVESNFNPKTISDAGAMGIMQIMPQYNLLVNKEDSEETKKIKTKNLLVPGICIHAGAKALRNWFSNVVEKELNMETKIKFSLARYNGGTLEILNKCTSWDAVISNKVKIPPQSIEYVPKVWYVYSILRENLHHPYENP